MSLTTSTPHVIPEEMQSALASSSFPTPEKVAEMRPVVRYQNSTPVAVAIIPVLATDPTDETLKVGLVTIRRSIPPAVGQLALPGGFVELEDWRDATRREVREEAGITLGREDDLTPIAVESVEQGKRLLIFGQCRTLDQVELPPFEANTEVSERVIIFRPTELAFPAHTQMVKGFFAITQ